MKFVSMPPQPPPPTCFLIIHFGRSHWSIWRTSWHERTEYVYPRHAPLVTHDAAPGRPTCHPPSKTKGHHCHHGRLCFQLFPRRPLNFHPPILRFSFGTGCDSPLEPGLVLGKERVGGCLECCVPILVTENERIGYQGRNEGSGIKRKRTSTTNAWISKFVTPPFSFQVVMKWNSLSVLNRVCNFIQDCPNRLWTCPKEGMVARLSSFNNNYPTKTRRISPDT